MGRIRTLASALLLTTALAMAAPVHAGTIETLPAAAPSDDVPGPASVMRNWVQLVWNPVSRQLERLAFSAWDPFPALGLELSWEPDDKAAGAAGPLSGRGTLSFRKPGAASYDRSATIAQYRGMLLDGRPEGEGEYLSPDGSAYAGSWHLGLMDGDGRLTTADGNEYVGHFRAGLRDGDGVFTDATGRRYAGSFTAGAPDPQSILAAGADGFSIGVVAERRPHNYDLGFDPLSYTSRADGETLEVFPDDQRLLDVWHGNVPITMTADEVDSYEDLATTPSFLGALERFDPLSLVFSLENRSTEPATVVGGYIDVSQSVRDPEPAVQVRPYPRDPCSGAIEFLSRFFIDNFGWTPLDNARLQMTAGALDGRSEGTPFGIELGQIALTHEADVADGLRGLGLDLDYLTNQKFVCTDPNDKRLCLGELKQSGKFGKLADYLSLDYTTVEARLTGTLDYDWQAADGIRHKNSPFEVILPIGSVSNEGECGEGGEVATVRRDPFVLQLDAQNYRIALPFKTDVQPGFTARWRVELEAPETSIHDFRVVLLLSNRTTVMSRPIHLTYFMPPAGKPYG